MHFHDKNPSESLMRARQFVRALFPSPGATSRAILIGTALLAHSFAGAQDLGKRVTDAGKSDGNWYASWGYSRQQYADSDIHVRQPSEGSDFVVHRAKGSDDPAGLFHIVRSVFTLNVTAPQENIRIGRFVDDDRTFAIEFSLDHSKYNTNNGQVAHVTGSVEGVPYDGAMTLDKQHFEYALHNGLNHVMINGVWFHHLRDVSLWQEPGDLQLVSRLGAGLLIPHAENTILSHDNSTEMGTKRSSPCCSRHDWWQVNGWTVGTEVGFRYAMTRSLYAELTQKFAYGKLHGVPVYHGLASQEIWMSEQVLSVGVLF